MNAFDEAGQDRVVDFLLHRIPRYPAGFSHARPEVVPRGVRKLSPRRVDSDPEALIYAHRSLSEEMSVTGISMERIEKLSVQMLH